MTARYKTVYQDKCFWVQMITGKILLTKYVKKYEGPQFHAWMKRKLMLTCMYTPNANMVDHSVGACYELHESDASEASAFCFTMFPLKSLASWAV